MPKRYGEVRVAVGTCDRRGKPTTVAMNLRCPGNSVLTWADEKLDAIETYRDGDPFGGVTSDGEGLRDPLDELLAREEADAAEPEPDPYACFANLSDTPIALPEERSLAACDKGVPAGACRVVVKPRRKLGLRNKPSERATAADLRKFAG